MPKNELQHMIKLQIAILNITCNMYSFAAGAMRKTSETGAVEHAGINKAFFQLMPDSTPDDPFFQWYIQNHPYNQFHTTIELCAIEFLYHWGIWRKQS